MPARDTIETRKRAQFTQAKSELLTLEERRRGRDAVLRQSFVEFTKQVFKTVSPAATYNHNWHIEAICEYLEACRRGEIRRLIINMPPRSMKSITCTVGWPAWLMGHEPGTQIIAGSYAASLAQKHSMDTQLVMNSRWYNRVFENIHIDPRQADKRKFVTTERGHRLAVSTGSQATGEGADFIIIDDPTNPAQAASDAERETANNWFDQTITSRQNDKNTACMVVVMQRLHEEDLSGHLLDKGGWTHLNLQAKAEEKRIISIGNFRKVIQEGELLDPVRLSQKVLDETESDMGAYPYAGQYQQNPAPDEGGILKKKHWRKWLKDTPPSCDYIIQTLDTAFEEKEENDYSVITTWGIFMSMGLDGKERAGVMLLNCVYDHWSYPDLKIAAIKEYKLFKPDKVIIEKKASGMSLLQDLRKMGYPVVPFSVAKDKVYRANVASPVLEKGHVFYMERDWSKKVIKECAVFPNGANDDIVDTCTMAWLYLRKRFWLELEEDEALKDRMPTRKKKQKKKGYGNR